MDGSQPSRRFHVHDRGGHRQAGSLIRDAEDFHTAAVAFAEQQAGQADDGAVSVLVKDCDTGEEQCFVVHLDDGSVSPC